MNTEDKPKEYYIVSLKHTSKKDTAFTFWCHAARGYTWNKDSAGLYKEEELPEYVNENNIAVFKDDAERFWLPGNDFGDKFIAVPNNTTTQKALGLPSRLMKEGKFASCRIKF